MAENPVSELLKKTKAAGTDVVPESAAVKGNMENVNAYKAAYPATSPAPKPTPSAPAKPSPVDKVNPSGKYGDKAGEMTPEQMNAKYKDLPKMHSGGTVMQSGPHNLQKGEKVLTKDQHSKLTHSIGLAADALSHDGQPEEPQEPPKIIRAMHIRKAADGSHVIEHHHVHHPMEEHTAKTTDELHDHIEQHWGEPNDTEHQSENEMDGSPAVVAMQKELGFKK